jgi:hypothetical protein
MCKVNYAANGKTIMPEQFVALFESIWELSIYFQGSWQKEAVDTSRHYGLIIFYIPPATACLPKPTRASGKRYGGGGV